MLSTILLLPQPFGPTITGDVIIKWRIFCAFKIVEIRASNDFAARYPPFDDNITGIVARMVAVKAILWIASAG